ncbi:hypothetical protein OMW55_01830 [Sphingomonas sp. BN140010]|uniref:Tyrosine-protein kinase G-rich domain-containing protein n=1 Tax=Sphingomonas arvum TaxID=2992113 RepID=A0ABT3JBV0_9SPHN|nr:GNVR domain-containing protein [Sphingomonas sp. BN140010]MCW3796548.1 hypothetical protein [Sphingomonas sp. BN140010]
MLSFYDWIDAIRYRWKLVVFTMGVLALLGLLYVAVTPRVYTATSSLLLDTGAPDPVGDENGGGRQQDNRAVIATQADLVRSPHVSGNAAVLSGIAKDPRYIEQWREATGGKVAYADWLRGKMRGALEVEPGRDTNVLLIKANASDPKEAARIANGYARASVESQYRLRTEPAKAYATWLENRLKAAQINVDKSGKQLSSFARATGITNDGDLSSEGSLTAEVSTQLAAAEARAAAARQTGGEAAQARGDAEKSETVQRLRGQVAERSGKLAELQAVFGPDYPDVQRTRAEVATLQSQLNAQLANANSTFNSARAAQTGAERAAAAASEARLRGLAAQQRSRMLSMGTNLAKYQQLKNEFQAAQTTYNDLNQRLTKMRLQSAVPLTEVQVLDTASTPLVPSSPNVGLTLALSLVLGALLGAGAAIWLELRDPRVRSRIGLERRLGAPVIGTIALPRYQGAIGGRNDDNPLLLEGRAA